MRTRTIAGRLCAHCGSTPRDGVLFPFDVPRFFKYIELTETCWIWIGHKNSGYGKFGLGRQVYLAHRIAYEQFVGRVPAGLFLDHTCRNRACVNPAHLEAVTPSVNTRRSKSDLCVRGHQLSGENLVASVMRRRGVRTCATCKKQRERAVVA